jgi:vitamin B12 transporter
VRSVPLRELRLALIAASSLPLLSQISQAQVSSSPVVLPEIVVSATTIPTPADQIANSVTIITDREIQQKQYRTVPDALSEVPGLNVVQSGGPGGQTSVFIRGTNSNHVKVLIDGIDMGDPSTPNGAFDFAHLLAGDIARIEVLRGPQSGLYGSDAIGGVISITTKKGEGPAKATGMIEGGSFQTFNQAASLSGSQPNFDYTFNVLHFRAGSVPVTPINQLPPGTPRNNDSYDNWTYSTKLGGTLAEGLQANVVARYVDTRRALTGDDCTIFPCVPEPVQSAQKNQNLYTRGELVWSPFGEKLKNYFGVNYTNQQSSFSDPNPDSGFTSPVVFPPTHNVGERLKFDWRGVAQVAPGEVLVLGLEHQRDSLDTNSTGIIDPFFNFTQTSTAASIVNKAAYAELQSNIAERFFLVSNIREDVNEQFGSHTTYRVAPAFILPVTNTKLKGSYGTGFKAPTLFQLYANTLPFSLANPALRPEESRGYDLGFEQAGLGGALQFGVTYFHNDIKNQIAFVADPNTFVGTNVNVNTSTIHGYEAFATLKLSDQLRLRGDYTFTHVEASSLAAMQRRPGQKYSGSAIWTPIAPLEISATVVTVSSWFDIFNRSNAVFQFPGGYTVVNLAANYRVDERVQLFARADNLFDRHYEEPAGFLRPGLGVYGGIRVMSEVQPKPAAR